MAKSDIGKQLRQYRNANHYSVQYVIDRLKDDYNISYTNKAVYSWENGTSQPPADVLLILCKIYEMPNILENLGYVNPDKDIPLHLTNEEKDIILKMRSHKYFGDAVRKLMELED